MIKRVVYGIGAIVFGIGGLIVCYQASDNVIVRWPVAGLFACSALVGGQILPFGFEKDDVVLPVRIGLGETQPVHAAEDLLRSPPLMSLSWP